MKAILTKYLGPTNLRGSRFTANDGDGNRVILNHSAEWSLDQCHAEAVKKLCAKRGWHGTLIQGYLMRGGHQEARVWVWAEFGQGRNKGDCLTV